MWWCMVKDNNAGSVFKIGAQNYQNNKESEIKAIINQNFWYSATWSFSVVDVSILVITER